MYVNWISYFISTRFVLRDHVYLVLAFLSEYGLQAHHILAEVIQGGLVLETNVEEIASAIEENSRARKASYAAANPLSLAGGVIGGNSRGANAGLGSSLGWLTERLTGVGSR